MEEILVTPVTNDKKFRTILFTQPDQQVTKMWLFPAQTIPRETHDVTQTLYVVLGNGEIRIYFGDHIDLYEIHTNDVLVIPAGTSHEVIAGTLGLQLLSVYGRPLHPVG